MAYNFKRGVSLIIFVFICLRVPISAQEDKIRPGTVITEKNYENYSKELKKVFTPAYFITVSKGVKNGWITIPVVKKRDYPLRKGFAEATRNNTGKFKVGEKNKIIGKWTSGSPFPQPETPKELAWDVYRRGQLADDLEFISTFRLYDKKTKLERTFEFIMWCKLWVGRTDIPPIPEMPGNNGLLGRKESLIFYEPFDVKGFSQIRIRYEDIEKNDEVYAYIPAIRRLRRLTGADFTDPILGSDDIPDDFEVWRQKINTIMTFKILGVKDFLVPGCYNKKPPEPFIKRNCFQVDWEKRPLYILEVDMNDKDYVYKKRVIYAEKEDGTFSLYGGENYDQKGRMWRSWTQIVQAQDIKTLFRCWWGFLITDHLTSHSTMLPMYPKLRDVVVSQEVFTIRGLLKRAK
ncbi:MAG: DUF1329 domain-containing protein [Thermodesulfobacteriota bacterium]|nr:DUF1329 domain-containing protein [Thermodesulfobacteriota bacterium]